MRTLIFSMIFCCLSQHVVAQCNATITPLSSMTFCQGGSVTLQGSSGDLYKWYLNGNLIAVLVSDTLNVNTAGSYTVVIDSSGCIDTSSATVVTVNSIPAQPGVITGPATTCYGNSYTFSILPVPGATNYTWYTPTSWGPTTNTTYSVTLQAGASQTTSTPVTAVSVKANNVCGSSDTTSINFDAYMMPHAHLNQNPVTGPAPMLLTGYTSHYGGLYYIPTTAQYRWKRNGSIIPGATAISYNATSSGMYAFIASYGGCPDETIEKSVTITTVSVEALNRADLTLQVYPNPNAGTFNLTADIPQDKAIDLTVLNTTGATVLSKAINIENGILNESIQIGDGAPTGIYFLKLQSEHYNKVISFVKQ
jgi:hypothetical protein